MCVCMYMYMCVFICKDVFLHAYTYILNTVRMNHVLVQAVHTIYQLSR